MDKKVIISGIESKLNEDRIIYKLNLNEIVKTNGFDN